MDTLILKLIHPLSFHINFTKASTETSVALSAFEMQLKKELCLRGIMFSKCFWSDGTSVQCMDVSQSAYNIS